MTEAQKTRVAVNGYGVIGKRVAAAVVRQEEGRDLRRVIPLIKARQPIDPKLLADENIDLRQIPASRSPFWRSLL